MSTISKLLLVSVMASALFLTQSGAPQIARARAIAPSAPPSASIVKDKDDEGKPCKDKDEKDKDKDDKRCPDVGSSNGIAKGDFNGDGFGDLAIGVPFEDLGGIVDAGAVHILYGSADGLTTTGNQFFSTDTIYGPGVARSSAQFGAALAAGDFNGDGRSDLAISSPGYILFGQNAAGYVDVLYGSANGLTTTGFQFFVQGESGLLDTVEAGDRFGQSLSWGDFNGDGIGDLAVGVPFEDIGTVVDAGAVQIIYGSSAGLTTAGNNGFSQNTVGIEDSSESFDHYGETMAGGDFNGDGKTDLAVGISDEDVGNISNAGAVNVIYGASTGLVSTDDQFWTQNDLLPFSSGIGLEGSEAGDHFGAALAAGDFDDDGIGDLAIGAPFEDVRLNLLNNDPPIVDGGEVRVLYGTVNKLSTADQQAWNQNIPGIEDIVEAGDRFGSALAAGNFDAFNGTDLAIGVPFEDVGRVNDAGAVNVIYGYKNIGLDDEFGPNLPASVDQIFTQDTSGILDVSETGDQYGASLTAWNFGRNSGGVATSDLAVGVPFEDINGQPDAGAVNVLYGSPIFVNPNELSSSGNQFFSQETAGIVDTAEANDRFGISLY